MYVSIGLIFREALPIALLLSPVIFTLWSKRGAAQGASDNGIKRWRDYRRNHRAVNLLLVAAWCALWDWNGKSFPVPQLVQLRIPTVTGASMQSALYWLLPATFLLASEIISYNASRKINELHWSHSQVLRQGFWEVFRYVLPLLLVGAGFEYVFDGEFAGIALILAALPIAAVGKVRLEGALGFKSRLLKTGELRNRAFRMAEAMGVELKRVYIVPQGKGHLTNAYAGGFGSISLTDTLSHSLNYKELNCTIVHELAHLKLGHIRGFFRDLTLPYALLVVLLFEWPSKEPMLRPFLEFMVVVLPVLILEFFSRLREYAADREEVTVLGDPEASIGSLVKLHQTSHVPRQWGYFSELFSSHPSLERRAKAIAHAGNLPEIRASDILEDVEIRGARTSV